jgi:hypothetical protein
MMFCDDNHDLEYSGFLAVAVSLMARVMEFEIIVRVYGTKKKSSLF